MVCVGVAVALVMFDLGFVGVLGCLIWLWALVV